MAVVDRCGMASNQCVDLSMIVNSLLAPSQLGRGPTRLTWMWLKWRLGMMGCRGAVYWSVTLPRWQCWQSLHQATMSEDMPFHSQRDEINCWDTLMPGWANTWIVVKTDRRWDLGTTGLEVTGGCWAEKLLLINAQFDYLQCRLIGEDTSHAAVDLLDSDGCQIDEAAGRGLHMYKAGHCWRRVVGQALVLPPFSAAFGSEGSCPRGLDKKHPQTHSPADSRSWGQAWRRQSNPQSGWWSRPCWNHILVV